MRVCICDGGRGDLDVEDRERPVRRELARRRLDVTDYFRFDGFDGITLRDLDDLRPHPVHDFLVQVVVRL